MKDCLAGITHKKLLDQILCFLIKTFWERVLHRLDLLQRKVFRKTLERKSTSDHTIDDATQSPQVGASDEG